MTTNTPLTGPAPDQKPYRDGTWVNADNNQARACFTDIGEGYNGEFNDDDPNDAALYRLDVEVAATYTEAVDGEETGDPAWIYPADGSICTMVHVDGLTSATAHDLLTHAANATAAALPDGSIKSVMDTMSYLPTRR